MIGQRIDEYLATLLPASFGGVEFTAQAGEHAGGWDVAVERRVGVGARVLGKQPALEEFPLTGAITGPDTQRRRAELVRLFRAGPDLLAHPWAGLVMAKAVSWRFSWMSEQLEIARLQVTFQPVDYEPTSAQAPAPQSADQAMDELGALGADFAAEPLALDQWQRIEPGLALEPPGLTGSDYTEQATRSVLAGASPTIGGLPQTVAETGDAVRAAETGSLRRDQWRALDQTLLEAAVRHDSLTLWRYREVLAAFVGPHGLGSLAQLERGDGRTIHRLATRGNMDLATAAARNRTAVAHWYARGEVSL